MGNKKHALIKKVIITLLVLVLLYCLCLLTFTLISCLSKPNENYLQNAMEAEVPNHNFMFASNASLPGRIFMTFSGRQFKTCINTTTSFYNKYNTCSNCRDFVKNPEKWDFEKVETPNVGDMVIYYRSNDPTYAYHASIIVDIKGGQLYVNHANLADYYKNENYIGCSRKEYYRIKLEK